MKVEKDRVPICSGCYQAMTVEKAIPYRKKFWCGSSDCQVVIDEKVKILNRRKKRKAKEKGRYRKGVDRFMKRIVHERDSHRCVQCLLPGNNLDAHHIIPVSDGGLDEVSNMITLCRKCHTEVHKIGWESFTEVFSKKIEEMERPLQ